jgi:hypothetical protein
MTHQSTPEPTLRALSKDGQSKLWSYDDGKGQITDGDEKPSHANAKVSFQGLVAHLYLSEWNEVEPDAGN